MKVKMALTTRKVVLPRQKKPASTRQAILESLPCRNLEGQPTTYSITAFLR